MSVARVFRYFFGVIIALILLVIVLPFAGVPSSHYLPPAHVWDRAKGETRGVITGKYYDITNNPFDVGGKQYFINYQFRAKSPGPRGEPGLGAAQVYTGTVRVDQNAYHAVVIGEDQNDADKAVGKTVIPAAPGQVVRIKFEQTYPYISGIDAPWGGRNILEGSNSLSGWIIWLVLAFVLGYFVMMLIERFGNKENI